jgi:LEA14-like dessication related protein
MKKKLKYISLFLLIFLIVFGSCVYVFRNRIMAHYRPELKQVGVIHINMKGDTSYINSKLEIKSNVFFKIKVDTIKYHIDLFDKTYLQSTEALGIQLPAYGRDTIDFLIKIPHRSLMKGIKAERKKGDSAGYEINIALQVSTPFWKGEIPFNRSAKLKIPTPPQLELVEIKYQKIRLRSIIADAKIKITNNSNVTLSVRNMVYKMKILKQGDVKGKHQKTILLKPQGATYINLPMEINITHVGKMLWAVLNDRDNYEYTLSMNATIESISLVKESFQIELINSGNMELKK